MGGGGYFAALGDKPCFTVLGARSFNFRQFNGWEGGGADGSLTLSFLSLFLLIFIVVRTCSTCEE